MKTLWSKAVVTFAYALFPLLIVRAEEVRWITVPVNSRSLNYYLNVLFLTNPESKIPPPLVVISHGSPIDPSDRPRMVPETFLSQAHEFLKLGFAVLIVERRGYGRSTEKYVEIVGDCDHRDNKASGTIASSDILGAVDYAQKNLLIDKEQIILVGQSAGGFSSLFASGYMHSGIKAVINFAGGRGAKGNNVVCSEQNLLDANSFAGSTSRVPSLWIYNENDQAFSPALAQAMYKAFTSFGGQGEFFLLAPFGKDGHRLFGDILGIPIWQPLVKQFFQKIKTCPLCQ